MWNEEGVGGKEEGDHQEGEGYRKGQGEQDPHASCLCKGHSTHYCTLLFGADKKNSILKEGCPQTRVSLTEAWQKHRGSQGMAESPQRFPTSR